MYILKMLLLKWTYYREGDYVGGLENIIGGRVLSLGVWYVA